MAHAHGSDERRRCFCGGASYPEPMTDDDMTDAEVAEIVAELEKAGLVTVTTSEAGQETYTLTEQGVRLGRMFAMHGDDAAEVLAGLLDEAEDDT